MINELFCGHHRAVARIAPRRSDGLSCLWRLECKDCGKQFNTYDAEVIDYLSCYGCLWEGCYTTDDAPCRDCSRSHSDYYRRY